MLIKLKKRVDADRIDEREGHADIFGSTRNLIVIAIEYLSGQTVFWLDHAGILISVGSDLVDISDGTLSRWWRAGIRDHSLFIGPPEMASTDSQVDPTERSESDQEAYATMRKRIFEEAAVIDPEAHDARLFSR